MEEARDLMEVALKEDITGGKPQGVSRALWKICACILIKTEDLFEWVFGSNIESTSSNLEEDGYRWSTIIIGPPRPSVAEIYGPPLQ